MDMSVTEKGLYAFGPFRLDPSRRVLMRDGARVAMPPKIFDTLLYFLENPDRVVSKDELLDVIWPGRLVEEANVSQTVFTLRKILGDDEDKRLIVTAPGRGYRFTAVVVNEGWKPQPGVVASPISAPIAADIISQPRKRSRVGWITAGTLAASALGAVVLAVWWYGGQQAEKPGTTVLVQFQNFTDDPVFDRVIGKALEIDLAQSPFVKVLSAQQVQDTLALMLRPKDEKLTPATAREVCSRSGGDVVLDGSIAALGAKYLLTLASSDCTSGRAIAEEKEEVDSKEAIVPALDRLAGRMRGKLGESVASIDRFNVPLLPEKTASFSALKAYSEAVSLYDHGQRPDAIGMFQHAIDLDPNFVMAYADLSAVYGSMHESGLEAADIAKAYALRDTVSEREKFFIEARYEIAVTKDLNAAIQTYKLWTEAYPREASPWANLSNMENWIGQYPPAIDAGEHALALSPSKESAHVVLARAYQHAGKFEQARKICEQAIAKGIAGEDTRELLLETAYALHDDALVAQQVEWSKGKPGERVILLYTALIALSEGKVGEGSALLDKEAELSKQQGLHDYMIAPRARALADFGFKDRAKTILGQLGDSTDPRDYLFTAAEVGDEARAETILQQDLAAAPNDTLLNNFYAPQVRAALNLRHGRAAEAVAALRPAIPYELKELDVLYLRGNAYLAASDGNGAAAEFRKILDNPGISPVSPLNRLSLLGLARAYSLQKDMPAATREYDAFFSAWKNADADIPILQAAKAEYSKCCQVSAGLSAK
jgi:eukaryotic-like serine/threonine-protein kinase